VGAAPLTHWLGFTLMIRWIAFDDETAEVLVSRFRRGAAEIHEGQPLDAALAHGKPSLLVLPSSTPGAVLLAHFEPRNLTPDSEHSSNPSPASVPVGYEPTGFLGLAEQPVFSKRPLPVKQEAKKKWWQRRSA
jgi:hypothetical protein